MPTRRRFARKKKRAYRPRRRKVRRSRPTISKALMPTPFPMRMFTKLGYHQNTNRAPAALIDEFQYRMNSIYDPDYTTGGHQPMFHDELAAIYDRYRVHGFGYKITVSGSNTPIRVAVVPVNGAAAPVDIEDCSEMKYSKNTIVNAMANGYGAIRTFKGYFNIAKILGEKLTDDRDQAPMGSNPSNILLFNVMVSTLDGATNITGYNITIDFTYFVELFDRKAITGS